MVCLICSWHGMFVAWHVRGMVCLACSWHGMCTDFGMVMYVHSFDILCIYVQCFHILCMYVQCFDMACAQILAWCVHSFDMVCSQFLDLVKALEFFFIYLHTYLCQF